MLTQHNGLPAVQLTAPDGARATVLLHGAHLVSWVPAGADEQLYLSPKSAHAEGKAVRGGVPVIFPQFAERGSGPRHGFARTRTWELVHSEQGEHDALAVLRLVDDEATRAAWPHAFEAELSVRIAGRVLEIELACENRAEVTFQFSAALHTYLRVSDLGAASVEGLEGLAFEEDGVERLQREMLLLPTSAGLDRIYRGVDKELLLKDDERSLQIGQQGFDDAVVWNPGAAGCAQLSDMPADGWRKMLCVEAGSVMRPVELAAGESWSGLQRLSLL